MNPKTASAPHDSEPSGQALPAGTRLEEFLIERVLGSGGFGITYLARDTSLSRQVVIKENLPAQFTWRDPASGTVRPRHSTGGDVDDFAWSMKNFLREAETLASLDHPGIVNVLRKFEANGTAYFVMPFVEGIAFDTLIDERRTTGQAFSEAELKGLLERTLDALAHLHDRGIYHRDIKPANILISNEGVPTLIDFGSARQRLSERSMTVVESAGYTPFEQLQSRGNVGPWSDLYALAGTLIKAITFETPPKANDRIRNDPHMPLAKRPELADRYSPAMLAALDRAFEVDEGNRWQNAGEWLAALRVISPVTMHPPKPERTDRPQRIETSPQDPTLPGRKVKPLPWMIAASVVLGLIALATTFSDKRELDKAEAATARAKDAEERVARALAREEQERQAFVADAKAMEEAAAKEAERQRATRAEQERQALVAEAQAKEDADAKAKSEELSLPGSKAGEEREFEIAPGMKITMCWIPPGDFVMGSPAGESGRRNDETQHRVTLTQGFWLAKTETTQAQWQAVMGSNPSKFKGGNLPVETVSWNDIAGPDGFISKVNQSATAGRLFSLPTEAQWEYACRAGTTGSYAGNLDEMAWNIENSGSKTHPVGQKKANAWGLQDMHGNVWEWCADWYGEYSGGAVTDPRGSPTGSYLVFRGGGWDGSAGNCRATGRYGYRPSYPVSGVGFRLARSSVP